LASPARTGAGAVTIGLAQSFRINPFPKSFLLISNQKYSATLACNSALETHLQISVGFHLKMTPTILAK
jgi:hypothetical protein